MKYALTKFRVYLLDKQYFIVYTDHASLRTAHKLPHLSQRMARWLSFFAEYNLEVKYKAGKENHIADALSRRPDYEPPEKDKQRINVIRHSRITVPLHEDIKSSYERDSDCKSLIGYLRAPHEMSLTPKLKAQINRYTLYNGLVYY